MKQKQLIYFATSSQSKISEYRFWLQDHAQLRWRKIAVEEPLTLSTDILIRRKVSAIKTHLPGLPFLVEQTVLIFNATKALHLPGTLTDRFLKLLGMKGVCEFLDGFSDRSARVRTDLAYHDADGSTHIYQAEVEGEIVSSLSETAGHGWQPIFIPNGHTIPFSDLTLEEQTQFSTRYEVVSKLTRELNKLYEDGVSGLSIEAKRQLRNQIDASFTLVEIASLCFYLNIDKDEIMPPGTSKGQAIMSLMEYCSHRQMTGELLDVCQEERPNVAWQF